MHYKTTTDTSHISLSLSLTLYFPGNNVIEYDEYVSLLKNYIKDPVLVECELREAFRVFDKDRNNNLNFAELKKALTSLGEPMTDKEAKELCTLMDADGDNKVDVEGKEAVFNKCMANM